MYGSGLNLGCQSFTGGEAKEFGPGVIGNCMARLLDIGVFHATRTVT